MGFGTAGFGEAAGGAAVPALVVEFDSGDAELRRAGHPPGALRPLPPAPAFYADHLIGPQ